ncbi:MAG: glycosyltransferase, partial [Bacteroidota bacterium]
KYGHTKFGLERYIRGFLDLMTVLFLTLFAARPMHFFGTMGTLSFLGGFVISLWLTYDKIFNGIPLSDRPLLLQGAILLVIGVQLFLVGFLCEMVIRPRMEQTSTYHIREVTAATRRAEV